MSNRKCFCLSAIKGCRVFVNQEQLCEIESVVSDEVIFVKREVGKSCDHMIPFGVSSVFCDCPIRLEIYKQYRI